MSNKITAPVRQFTIPRLLFIFGLILIIIPVILLQHYVSFNEQLSADKNALHQEISTLENANNQLATDVERLIAEREQVINRYHELDEIEETIHDYMKELPDEALGGIEIPLNENNMIESPDELLLTSNWTERYHSTINSIEMLEHNLIYIPTHWPTEPNVITSSFGPRNDPFSRARSIHSGIDVRGKTGTPIYAAADGTVQFAQYHGGYGNTIMIDHGGRYETLYAHLYRIHVEEGEKVRKGDTIGELGSTGRSTGPHLHYEIIKDGQHVDPEPYLDFFNDGFNEERGM